jgi:diguanylate cyclase (GGDEF)-like protein
MKWNHIQTIYTNEEDRYLAKIFLRIILGLITGDIVVICAALIWKDWSTFTVGSFGCVLFLIPLWLLFKGHLRICGLIFVLITLVTVTVAVTFGQGIHDIGIIAYPMIIVVVSLILKRREYFIISTITLGALAWLVFGELFDIFTVKPITTPIGADFIVVAAIFLIAVVVVDSVAENMRRNLRLANQEIAQRKILEEQLRFQSTHDILTGLYNRTFFEEELLRIEKSREFPVSIIITDVDDLKIINDTQGHAIGDELLRHLSQVLQKVFRASDVVARIGGDEFVVLLTQTDSLTVAETLLRIREKIYEHNIEYPDLPLSASLGASTVEGGKLSDALSIADRRMYVEKVARKAG